MILLTKISEKCNKVRVGRKGEPANLKGGLSLTSEEPL